VDTRASCVVDLTASTDDSEETKREQQQVKTILRREYGDSRPDKTLDGSQNSVDSKADSTVDGVINLKSNQSNNTTSKTEIKQSPDTMARKANMNSTAPKSSSMRSLSSLLSGAKTTQEMQQTPKRQRPPPRRNIARPQPTSHNNPLSTTASNNPNHTQMTVSGGVTLTISEAEAKSISEADAKKLKESKQLCLVLDLDHTLLHATDDYRAGRFVADEIFVPETTYSNNGDEQSSNQCIKIPQTTSNPQKRNDVRSILLPCELPPAQYHQYVQRQQHQMQQCPDQSPIALPPIPDQKLRHFVKLRPHLKEFFTSIQSTYKLSVYTAGTRAYAERIAVMICRHLVGAPLDEEGLSALRVKVREKDDEWKRYKNWLERKKQLKLAKERDAAGDTTLTIKSGKVAKGKKKGVSFDAPPSNDEEQLAKKVDDSLKVSPDKSANRTDESCTKRRVTESEAKSTDGHIPRKKRKVEPDSLISLIAPPANEATKETAEKNDKTNIEKEDLKDPSKERDKLRKQLEEAEALEVEATSLRRKLFGSRIVSRTDVGDLGADVKSLKRVFPCGGVMVSELG
jgi:RNA polymerase II subunit A-like phosphatase